MLPTAFDCQIIQLNRLRDRFGSVTSAVGHVDVPFDVARVFYIYDIPAGQERGAHAHKCCHQVIVAVSGSFEIELDDGEARRIIQLNRPDSGLHIPPGIWLTQRGYSAGSVSLVLTSEKYQEEDYIRDYELYMEFRSSAS